MLSVQAGHRVRDVLISVHVAFDACGRETRLNRPRLACGPVPPRPCFRPVFVPAISFWVSNVGDGFEINYVLFVCSPPPVILMPGKIPQRSTGPSG